MPLLAASPLGFTLALLATFIGIGILMGVVVTFIVVVVLAERRANQINQQTGH